MDHTDITWMIRSRIRIRRPKSSETFRGPTRTRRNPWVQCGWTVNLVRELLKYLEISWNSGIWAWLWAFSLKLPPEIFRHGDWPAVWESLIMISRHSINQWIKTRFFSAPLQGFRSFRMVQLSVPWSFRLLPNISSLTADSEAGAASASGGFSWSNSGSLHFGLATAQWQVVTHRANGTTTRHVGHVAGWTVLDHRLVWHGMNWCDLAQP